MLNASKTGSANAYVNPPDIYASLVWRRKWFIGLLGLLLLAAVPVCTMFGAAQISLADITRAILERIAPFLDIHPSELARYIVWDVRLPRVLMAVVAGAGLAISGAAMQGALRNPLVSPYTMGVSSAAGFGAALAMVLGAGLSGMAEEGMVISNAFFFGLLAALMAYALSRLRSVSPESIILAGIAIMFFFSAGTSLLQYLASDDKLRDVVFWLMGNLGKTGWTELFIIGGLSLLALPFLWKFSWDLNTLSTGDESARSLGTNVNRVRLICMAIATLVTAGIVSFCGIIGFICLVAPHITRMVIGADHRFLLPASALTGSLLLLVADTFARNIIQPTELPIGILTSLIGVPFFVYLLLTRKKEYFQ
ncbi:MAG: iron ABC transporter permease [Dehalococcoides mccartyi]|uniref:Vitamin B12 import system permease protein BtuC n=1 Tax=bioreactor metagenome TaxID=1076179 RepID=A0A644T4U5_9ZZZZ|nr:iron ABC transporter permease [Dehalococcoides mccartyi]MCF7635294.1 iron ABC transporter permease [Dehalococcoides mccartyi]MEA2122215.1 Vitamin B12 import system permease protein BtuC [Dehalococcoides mccartyi]